MINTEQIFIEIERSFDAFIEQRTPQVQELWRQFIAIHPADIAQFLGRLDKDQSSKLVTMMPQELLTTVFEHCSDYMKVFILSFLPDAMRRHLLQATPIDELTDFFELLSDEELKHYLQLLNERERRQVLSLLKFSPQSAAGIMDIDVLTLREDFTVEKSIHILQRLKPRLELHQQLYVTNRENQLVGYIGLEDLVLRNPKDQLKTFMKQSEIVVSADEDQEEVAKHMIHYHLVTVPVVGDNNYFLGVVPSQTLAEIIEQEASEDVYRISAMTPITRPYFETSFFRILYERSYILIILLLAQSISTMIIHYYEATLIGFLLPFITMLTSAGGNSSSQTSAVVIQGMASEEIDQSNVARFLRREMRMALLIALILGSVAFIRVYFTHHNLLGSTVVSLSLTLIVLVSVILGSGLPIILKRFGVDPAFAAGPFLATIMDILGIFIYCLIGSFFF
jgi:magnesium transporter